MSETIIPTRIDQRENTTAANAHEKEEALSYEIVDFTDEEPSKTMAYLKELAEKKNKDGGQEYVFHGAHMTGFHEQYGLPQVDWYPTLDPNASRQTEHPAIYATTGIEGALIHAILKHRPEDAGEKHGQTFALNMNGGGKEVLMSPQLQQAAERGALEFTDGFLYILPANEFTGSWQGGDHEVTANHEVTPLLGIKVGSALGPELLKHVQIVDFIEDQK